MSSAGFWAGDAIAQSMARAGDQARASATLDDQKAYHCGDLAIQNSALAALAELAPEHPLLNQMVREQIWERGKSTFYQHGWRAGSVLRIDAGALHQRLKREFEEARFDALGKAENEHVKYEEKGFFTSRKVFIYDYAEYSSEDDAKLAKAAEIARIKNAQLGDKLEFSVMEKRDRARARGLRAS